MGVTSHQSRTLSGVTTTELSIISGTSSLQQDTTAGGFIVELDLSDMVSGDVVEFRPYGTVLSGGTKRVKYCQTFRGAQGTDNAIWQSPTYPNLFGMDFTLKATAGTVDIPATIYKLG